MSTTNPQLTEVAAGFEHAGSVAERMGPRLRPETPSERVLRVLSNSFVTIIVVVIGLAWSIPTIGLLITSFRPVALINTSGWWTAIKPPWQFTIENYQTVITTNGLGQAFINSLIISIPSTILTVFVASFAAYAFAWMKFPGRDWIFLTIIGLQVVPLQLALIPVLSIFVNIGISGSFVSIWLFHMAYGLPFAIYLLRSFFGALPSDLFESAHIDGAGHVTVFFRLLLPLSVPSLAALVIFQFMWVWNDLLVALILLGGSPDKAPMTVVIANLVNAFGSGYQLLTAAAFLSMALPLIVFFSLQRYFVRGILAGSIKG
jgi:alpha-glucoside transport system permease protein